MHTTKENDTIGLKEFIASKLLIFFSRGFHRSPKTEHAENAAP